MRPPRQPTQAGAGGASYFQRTAPFVLYAVSQSCSCGGAGGASGNSDFHISGVNRAQNSVWLIHRPITIEFDLPLDFGSVIRVRSTSGS